MLLGTAVLDVSAETVPENLRPDDTPANLLSRTSAAAAHRTWVYLGREGRLRRAWFPDSEAFLRGQQSIGRAFALIHKL